jgi:hypothetical protein
VHIVGLLHLVLLRSIGDDIMLSPYGRHEAGLLALYCCTAYVSRQALDVMSEPGALSSCHLNFVAR